ncbi:hypothetical protein I4U23_000397 [Adineta vaga]|nr:hypothetical protein I4U23_000397 [Adineta vaga]
MSPAPTVTHETMILSEVSTTTLLNGISSSDELDANMLHMQEMDLGSLAINPMEDNDSSEDDGEPPLLTSDSMPPLTTCSIPTTSLDVHDPPVVLRSTPLAQIEVRCQTTQLPNSTNSVNSSGLIGTFFGCFKPILSAMNKFGENMKYTKDMTISTLTRPSVDWEIPIDHIMNDLQLIGRGIEGSVFHGKLNGQDVACKRVKNKEETNIKHLKKLNHVNVIKFRGISIASPFFYIVMEYCAYGSLYDLLKRRRDNRSCTKPTQVLDWSRQIASGVDYLHSNKIVHRDLKSPNILFSDERTLKISDFGTSKELGNRRSQIMSFGGTSAWMAPEVIRQELCSEKIDVWSFGIVVWEILTCAVPYNNIDPSAVMWGVGKGSLTLPIPDSVPEGFKLLMKMCWNQRPADRPSFPEMIKHLDCSEPNIVLFEREQEYAELTRVWSIEINEHLSKFPTIDISSTLQMSHDELLKKRQEELQHIVDIRTHYQKRIQQVDTLYIEMKSMMMQLEQRERVIKEKERLLKIHGKKQTINPISEARKKSLELIKIATSNLNDPMHFLLNKKRYEKKSIHGSLNNQSTESPTSLPSSIRKINQNSSQRRKSSNSRRNETKNNSVIEDQDKRRSSINITNNMTTVVYTSDQALNSSSEMIPVTAINSPLPTISGEIDLKSNIRNRQLNPKNLKLDLQNSKTSSLPPSNRQRNLPESAVTQRKSSSSGPEDFDTNHRHTYPRQRLRRTINSSNKTRSPSIKSNDQLPLQTIETNETYKHGKNVIFQLSPTTQRKLTRHLTYTSSEEGEVEEIHSDSYILDDEKRRAKHDQSYGNFSSEGEIYGEKSTQSSSKSDGTFSDEGGHVSDGRPESGESILNSEYIDEE